MSELLLELFSEEIPARMQKQAAETLSKLVTEALAEAGLAYEHADAYATPRRLALMVSGIPARQPDSREEKKGPRVGAPERALEGFMRGAGISSLDECEIQDDKKGQFYVAVIERQGRPAEAVLAEIIPEILTRFPWPKSMRWGAGALRWVRPLHSVLCVFGPSEGESKIIEFQIEGIRSGNITHGHRFMSPAAIEVSHFSDYETKLKAARVLLDPAARRERIRAEAVRLAEAEGLELVDDPRLLEEVAGLVEWPVPLMGRFPENYLELPKQVLESSMRKHQKYFSLRDPNTGKAANRFIVVSNLEAEDGGKAITGGNERVLNARLADARFFWDQDLKTPLNLRTPELDAITFHAKLGSQGERVRRITSLARDIAALVDANPDEAAEAAAICKSDLVTEMVGEFPDLQGLIGRIYAEKSCVKPFIAKAVEDHYKPQGPADEVPNDP
ncbi:MAG: glycine--tRNA ligase subunit beta, partial [Hyphomicrobiales bacterium]